MTRMTKKSYRIRFTQTLADGSEVCLQFTSLVSGGVSSELYPEGAYEGPVLNRRQQVALAKWLGRENKEE
jgi:hypothetical protein